MINTIPSRPGSSLDRPGRPAGPSRPSDKPSSQPNDRSGIRVYDTDRFLIQGTLIDWDVVRENHDLFPQPHQSQIRETSLLGLFSYAG